MYIVTVKNTNQIVGIGTMLEQIGDTFKVANSVYANKEVYQAYEVDVPEEVDVYTHGYTVEDGFFVSNVAQSYVPPEKQIENIKEEVIVIKHNQMTASAKYAVLDKETSSLTDLKKAKMAHLEELCNMAIISGFKHTVGTTEYLFSCSLSAQSNFQGTDALFKDGFITEAEWTVVNTTTNNVERVVLDQTAFNSVKLKVFQHINSNIGKFRNILQPQVEEATTNAEIDAINW